MGNFFQIRHFFIQTSGHTGCYIILHTYKYDLLRNIINDQVQNANNDFVLKIDLVINVFDHIFVSVGHFLRPPKSRSTNPFTFEQKSNIFAAIGRVNTALILAGFEPLPLDKYDEYQL